MKTLPSMSGLLPAQFKSDPASTGIGWGTINPKPTLHKSAHCSNRTNWKNALHSTMEQITETDLEKVMGFVDKDAITATEIATFSAGPEYEIGAIGWRRILDCLSKPIVGPYITVDAATKVIANPSTRLAETPEFSYGDCVYVLPDYNNICGDTLTPGGVYIVQSFDGYDSLLLRNCPDSEISPQFVKKITDFNKVLVGVSNNPSLDGHICDQELAKALLCIRFTTGQIQHFNWLETDIVIVKKDNQC